MQMAMFMKENGKMIKHMEKEFIFIVMVHHTLVNGAQIHKMDMV